jgi:hypothetical protein
LFNAEVKELTCILHHSQTDDNTDQINLVLNNDSIDGDDDQESKKIGDFDPFDCVLFATGRVPNVKGMDL